LIEIVQRRVNKSNYPSRNVMIRHAYPIQVTFRYGLSQQESPWRLCANYGNAYIQKTFKMFFLFSFFGTGSINRLWEDLYSKRRSSKNSTLMKSENLWRLYTNTIIDSSDIIDSEVGARPVDWAQLSWVGFYLRTERDSSLPNAVFKERKQVEGYIQNSIIALS
jgi:hypothetical protein